jgi:hypothetical protein
VTQDTDGAAFFTLDRGTVTTAATLIAPVEGRYRMLAATTAPADVDPLPLLEDLAWRVARTDASVAGSMEGWTDWPRLEVRTVRSPRACLVAASVETGIALEHAFAGAGWQVAGRFYGPEPDLIALGGTCLDPRLDALVVGGRGEADQDERDHARLLWPRAGSLARLRDDLALVACGPFVERPEGIPDERLFALPEPLAVPMTSESPLRQAAFGVGAHLVDGTVPPGADGRSASRAAIASLAVLLGNRVEGVDIGAGAGTRTLANGEGELRHAVVASARLLPTEILSDDEAAEAILRWSSQPGDPATRLDRLRELALRPWSAIDREGMQLRMAALRASLERLQASWDGSRDEGRAVGEGQPTGSDVVVIGGGGFAMLPAAACALAVADGLRRPGAFTILHDHARVLSPLGALPVEGDRRRLLADLMDDCLLPIGSAILTGSLGEAGRATGRLAISSSLGDDEHALDPDQVRFLDLPPGIVARLELDPGQGSLLGVTGRHLQLELSGGLGGLLVDTRPIPLELPAALEARRTLIEGWDASAWSGGEP